MPASDIARGRLRRSDTWPYVDERDGRILSAAPDVGVAESALFMGSVRGLMGFWQCSSSHAVTHPFE